MPKPLVRSSLALVLVLLVAPVARGLVPGAWVAPPPPASAPADVKQGCAQADALYATRENPKNLETAINLLRSLDKAHPGSVDVGWRLARALWWKAEGTPDKDAKKALALEGRAAGERALKANPQNPEALYFTSLCIGEYSHAVSIVTALMQGLESKFRDPLLEVAKVDPTIDNGGVWNALGRYKFELPWPKRDYDQSAKWLRKAIAVFPDDLRGKAYLAETLAKRDDHGDKAEAKKLFQQVLAATPGQYDRAEELRAQKFAREELAELGWKLP